ncbi:MAG TPA: carboxypeptidase-like regulatory domain-containing protein [Bacteroidia bacterium]|nr:carboxypeptidase-like regulatory domain-containing protein [Bacteroidia bacterium]
MKFFITCMLLFLAAGAVSAQEKTFFVCGHITNTDKQAVPFAGVQVAGRSSGTNADRNGFYILRTALPAIVKVSALGYKTQQRTVNAIAGADTIRADFILISEPVQLQPVDISSVHAAEKITEAVNLTDFELRDHLLWLLYSTANNNSLIAVTDTSGKNIHRFPLAFCAEGISRTQHGYVYAISGDTVYLFDHNATGFTDFTMPVKTFSEQVLPLVAWKDSVYYYEKKDTSQAMFSFWYFDKKHHITGTLYHFLDYEKYEANQETNYEINRINGTLSDNEKNGMMSENGAPHGDFSRMIALTTMIQPVYCPLRLIRDSVYIFNFDDDSIYVYGKDNRFVRRTNLAFDHYGLQYKNKDILVDEEGRSAYFKYTIKSVTYLEKINLDNGTKISAQSLDKFPFIEKIRISNGSAYFCLFDHSGPGKSRTLYKEKIN